MTRVLTDAERKKMCEWAKAATGGYTEVVGQAGTILQYEATLQAKDEQIAALVTAARAAWTAIDGLSKDALETRNELLSQLWVAIKEVADGS